MNLTVWITKGLPGSGKSTWAWKMKEDLLAKSLFVSIINKDTIREELGITNENWTQEKENIVRTVFRRRVTEAMNARYNVILNNTYMNANTLRKDMEWMKQQWSDRDYVIQDFTSVPIQTCIDRDNNRKTLGQRYVGEQVILKMARDAGIPRYPKYPVNENLPNCIICDLDGTVALFEGKRNPYDASKCNETDEPNPLVLDLIHTYSASKMINRFVKANLIRPEIDHVFFFSGRVDTYMEPTMRFLREKCQLSMTDFYSLEMRKSDDKRHDEIVKKEMFEENVAGKYNVFAVIDDRPKVVRMWKNLGLPVLNVGDNVEF